MSDCRHGQEIRDLERDMAALSPVEADRFHDEWMQELDLIEAECHRRCYDPMSDPTFDPDHVTPGGSP